MELKRPSRRESLIAYLLQPPVGANLLRPSAPSVLTRGLPSDASVDDARASFEVMSDAQIDELVGRKRQQEEEASQIRLAEEAKALAAKHLEEDRALFFNRPNAAADFQFWEKLACWSLEEAIALSLGKNPNVVNADALSSESYVPAAHLRSRFPVEYARRSEHVRRALLIQKLRDPIEPQEFLAWAQPIFEYLPPELLEQVSYTALTPADMQRLTNRIAELESVLHGRVESANHPWPWGPYETNLLRKLSAAASKFWVLYDPADATTAPTNDQVVSWLEKEGMSTNIAKAMATILRADGIMPGPRK